MIKPLLLFILYFISKLLLATETSEIIYELSDFVVTDENDKGYFRVLDISNQSE